MLFNSLIFVLLCLVFNYCNFSFSKTFNMLTWHQLILYFFCIQIVVFSQMLENKREKRFLIFPRQAPTRHQFISGIGIPADLSLESLTIGYVLKAMYYLPYNATVFRENPFFPEYHAIKHKNNYLQQRKLSKMDSTASALRWAVYQFIANRLESYGYNGQDCMLKAICEASALSFERYYNVFAELMHIFLSPRTSRDLKSELTTNYFEAEKLGNQGQASSCEIYNCKFSLLNLISKVFNV